MLFIGYLTLGNLSCIPDLPRTILTFACLPDTINEEIALEIYTTECFYHWDRVSILLASESCLNKKFVHDVIHLWYITSSQLIHVSFKVDRNT